MRMVEKARLGCDVDMRLQRADEVGEDKKLGRGWRGQEVGTRGWAGEGEVGKWASLRPGFEGHGPAIEGWSAEIGSDVGVRKGKMLPSC